MNNNAIGYWDGYFFKEAEEPVAPRSEVPPFYTAEDYANFQKATEGLSLKEKAWQYDFLQARAGAALKNDFFMGVAADPTMRTLAQGGIGLSIGAAIGGLVGGGKGAVAGGILGTLIMFVADAMGLIPPDAWKVLTDWREKKVVKEELGKLLVEKKKKGSVDKADKAVEGFVRDSPENTELLLATLARDSLLEKQKLGDLDEEDTQRLSLRKTQIKELADRMQSISDQAKIEEVEEQGAATTKEWRGDRPMSDTEAFYMKRDIQKQQRRVFDAQQVLDERTSKPEGVMPHESIRVAQKALDKEKKLMERTLQVWRTGVANTDFTVAAGDTFPSKVQIGKWDSYLTRLRDAPTVKEILELPDVYKDGRDKTWISMTGRNYDQQSWPTSGIQGWLHPSVATAIQMNPNLDGSFFNSPTFAGYNATENWRTRSRGRDIETLIQAANLGNTAAKEELSALGQTAPYDTWDRKPVNQVPAGTPPLPGDQEPVNPVPVVTPIATDKKVLPWDRNTVTPEAAPAVKPTEPSTTDNAGTREDLSTYKTGLPSDNNKKYKEVLASGTLGDAEMDGASRVLGMSWRAAQKLAAPAPQAQMQQDQMPQVPVQQEPTNKDKFDQAVAASASESKIKEMEMEERLIKTKAHASRAEAEQKTQTATNMPDPAQRTAPAYTGTGQYTAGAGQYTAGAGQSTVGAEQSTVGKEQSTAGTEPTAMAGSMSMNQPNNSTAGTVQATV